MVLYDETEYFRDYDSPEFNYPYQKRKTKVGSTALDFDKESKGDGNYDY